MHFEVDTTYLCHPRCLDVTNRNPFFPKGDLYPVIDVARIVGNVVGDPVIGNPTLTTSWIFDTLPNSLTTLLDCTRYASYSYPMNTQSDSPCGTERAIRRCRAPWEDVDAPGEGAEEEGGTWPGGC